MADLSGIDLPDDEAGIVLASTANERTYLAWTRTALSWGAVGAVMVRYHLHDEIDWPGVVAGIAMMICGGSTFLLAIVRYRRCDAILRSGEPRPPTPLATLRWVSVVMVTTALVVVGADLVRVLVDG